MQQDWNRFASILASKELAKPEQAGWSFRLPAPGAEWNETGLVTSTALPGLMVECNSGAGWVALSDRDLSGSEKLQLRTLSPAGHLHGRAVEVSRQSLP